MENAAADQYNWKVLQKGSLPLRPDGAMDHKVAHACTSVLMWPAAQSPTRDNSIITDPSFTAEGFARAEGELLCLGASTADIGRYFITHWNHWDHEPRWPVGDDKLVVKALQLNDCPPGMESVSCPGHTPDLCSLVFRSREGETVWIVGDAILDTTWLMAWRYYWPNGYGSGEIISTWRSVAKILSQADTVVPGHGPPFPVTRALLAELLAGFPGAELSSECPDVAKVLVKRIQQLQ